MANIPTLPKIGIVGKGSPNLELSAEELRIILDEALLPITAGARVLAIISDKTRMTIPISFSLRPRKYWQRAASESLTPS